MRPPMLPPKITVKLINGMHSLTLIKIMNRGDLVASPVIGWGYIDVSNYPTAIERPPFAGNKSLFGELVVTKSTGSCPQRTTPADAR
jgi:hypothetical protein